jgi:predicted RNA methylase
MSQLVIPGTPPPPKESLSQWDTPDELADKIAWLSLINPDMRVLEPSAGLGSLACAIRRQGVANVHCVELDPERAENLRLLGFDVTCADFLTLKPEDIGKFDRIVMNSPFEDGQDSEHLAHAMKFSGFVVAHVPVRILCGKRNHERLWSRFTLDRVAFNISRPMYAGSESTGRSDMCTVRMFNHGTSNFAEVSVEWWP